MQQEGRYLCCCCHTFLRSTPDAKAAVKTRRSLSPQRYRYSLGSRRSDDFGTTVRMACCLSDQLNSIEVPVTTVATEQPQSLSDHSQGWTISRTLPKQAKRISNLASKPVCTLRTLQSIQNPYSFIIWTSEPNSYTIACEFGGTSSRQDSEKPCALSHASCRTNQRSMTDTVPTERRHLTAKFR